MTLNPVEKSGPMRTVACFESIGDDRRIETLTPCRHVITSRGSAPRRRCPYCRDAMRLRHEAIVASLARGEV